MPVCCAGLFRRFRGGGGFMNWSGPFSTIPRPAITKNSACSILTTAAFPGRALAADPNYDFQRAKGLLAHAYAQTGQAEKAEVLFQQATKTSTSSETYYNYALFLQSQGRAGEAPETAQNTFHQ